MGSRSRRLIQQSRALIDKSRATIARAQRRVFLALRGGSDASTSVITVSSFGRTP